MCHLSYSCPVLIGANNRCLRWPAGRSVPWQLWWESPTSRRMRLPSAETTRATRLLETTKTQTSLRTRTARSISTGSRTTSRTSSCSALFETVARSKPATSTTATPEKISWLLFRVLTNNRLNRPLNPLRADLFNDLPGCLPSHLPRDPPIVLIDGPPRRQLRDLPRVLRRDFHRQLFSLQTGDQDLASHPPESHLENPWARL